MPATTAAAIVSLLVAAGAVSAAPRIPKPCVDEVGVRRAAPLLRDCRRVGRRAACVAEASCEAWRTEIRRGCEAAAGDALPLCEAYVEVDDDPDEDE